MGLVKARLYKTRKLHLTVWPLLIGMPCISISLAIEANGAGISFVEERATVCVYSDDLKPNVSLVQLAIAPHKLHQYRSLRRLGAESPDVKFRSIPPCSSRQTLKNLDKNALWIPTSL